MLFHIADSLFHRIAFGLGTINGLSMVIDPYGRIAAEGNINERGVILGEVFTTQNGAIYTGWGDWFGWLMMLGSLFLLGIAVYQQK